LLARIHHKWGCYVKFAPISQAIPSGIVVASPSPRQKIRVASYVLACEVPAGETCTFQWASSTGPVALSGPMPLILGTPFCVPDAGWRPGEICGYFETVPGDALVLLIVGGFQVSGHLAYEFCL
jgi:hypothetical protein